MSVTMKKGARWIFAGWLVAGSLGAHGAGADFHDPTRPPEAVSPSAAGVAPPAMIVQSIMRDTHGYAATIDGKRVRVGDRLGDSRILAISETSVTLHTPEGREVLALFPDIDKRMTARERGGRPPAHARASKEK